MSGFTLQPAVGDSFVGRRELISSLANELLDVKSTAGFALYGKRRMGKTSIFWEIHRILADEYNIVPVYFSVWSCIENTVPEFCRLLSEAVLDAFRPYTGLGLRGADLMRLPLRVLREMLDHAQLRFIYNDIELLLSFQNTEELSVLLEHTFMLPERLGERTGKKCVLMIDEFPSIMDLKIENTRIGEQIVKTIRSFHEMWKHTCLCVSGSIQSTMDLTVLGAGSPFFRQLIAREIKPLNLDEVEILLSRHLDIDRTEIEEIYRFSGGIPFYIQFLGKILERENRIDKKAVVLVEHAFLEEEGNILFGSEFHALSPKERLIVLGIAQGNRSPKELANGLGDRVSNVNRFLMYLEQKGIVNRIERGIYELEDPVFARWLKISV